MAGINNIINVVCPCVLHIFVYIHIRELQAILAKRITKIIIFDDHPYMIYAIKIAGIYKLINY